MKKLLIAVLSLGIAGAAVAEDTFGLWRLDGGEYTSWIDSSEVFSPFELFITVHAPSSVSIGGYEVGIFVPTDELLVLETGGPNGWTNFGDPYNHLVGFQTPVLIQEEVTVLGSMLMLGLASPPGTNWIEYHAAVPPSIPDHDGPVYADGANPDVLVPCDTVTGWPGVFMYGSVVATEQQTLTGVRSLFE